LSCKYPRKLGQHVVLVGLHQLWRDHGCERLQEILISFSCSRSVWERCQVQQASHSVVANSVWIVTFRSEVLTSEFFQKWMKQTERIRIVFGHDFQWIYIPLSSRIFSQFCCKVLQSFWKISITAEKSSNFLLLYVFFHSIIIWNLFIISMKVFTI
jgi:hypothetical protein